MSVSVYMSELVLCVAVWPASRSAGGARCRGSTWRRRGRERENVEVIRLSFVVGMCLMDSVGCLAGPTLGLISILFFSF